MPQNILQQVRSLLHRRRFDAENPFMHYIAVLALSYGAWKVYKWMLYAPGVMLTTIDGAFGDRLRDIHEDLQFMGESINQAFSSVYVNVIVAPLKLFGVGHRTGVHEASYGSFQYIALDGAGGIYVAYHCLGLTAFFVYNAVILLTPATWRRRLTWMALGTAAIFVVNALRMIALLFLDKYTSTIWFEMNHSLVFVILTYTTLFLMHLGFLRPKLSR